MTTVDLLKSNEFNKILHYPSTCPVPIAPLHREKFTLNESDSIRQVRIRSLSHWPHQTPSAQSMAAAGWLSCNIRDRLLCIYCDSICQEWTKDDDPLEVHARLAPQCPFVLSVQKTETTPKIVESISTGKLDVRHPNMSDIIRRHETFSDPKWQQTSPTADDLVRAGFFFSGVANTVTCFYCNGSLHQWGAADSPMLEHARWFPECTYARHLCGDELHAKVQDVKKPRTVPTAKFSDDEVNRLVTARLDLPEVQRLRARYSPAVIKRCLEDQLRSKHDDFASTLDLSFACLLLQKQIDVIKGDKSRITIPSKHRRMTATLVGESKQPLGECLICVTEEKQLACMPCGHLCACVPCGYALRSCPVCRQTIQSFLRVNSV